MTDVLVDAYAWFHSAAPFLLSWPMPNVLLLRRETGRRGAAKSSWMIPGLQRVSPPQGAKNAAAQAVQAKPT